MPYTPPIVDLKQMLIFVGGNILDGFLRGFLEQGVGRAASPILAAIWGVPYFLQLYLPQLKPSLATTPGAIANNLLATMFASETGGIANLATAPAATWLGEKAFGAASAASIEAKIKSWAAGIKAKISGWAKQVNNPSPPASNPANFTPRDQPSTVITPEPISKQRRVLQATR